MKIIKTILLFSCLIVGFISTTTYANMPANASATNGINLSKHLTIYTISPGHINCDQHNTDICINNKSGQKIYFSVPKLNSNSLLPLPNGAWADDYDTQFYPQLKTLVFNKNYKNIFNQTIPNHSIVEIDPGVTATSQPIARIIQ